MGSLARCWESQGSWPMSFWDLSLCLPVYDRDIGVPDGHTCAQLHVLLGSGGSESALLACRASTLPTAPSPLSLMFKSYQHADERTHDKNWRVMMTMKTCLTSAQFPGRFLGVSMESFIFLLCSWEDYCPNHSWKTLDRGQCMLMKRWFWLACPVTW